MMKKINIKNPDWVEVRIDFPYCMSFSEVYTWFKEQLKNYEPGTILIGKFNDKELNSNMTEDELWISYWGRTKEEEMARREQVEKEAREEYEKSKKELEELKKKHELWAIENYGSVDPESGYCHCGGGLRRKARCHQHHSSATVHHH